MIMQNTQCKGIGAVVRRSEEELKI